MAISSALNHAAWRVAVVKPDAKLCGELLDGLGLRRPNRQTVKALAALTDELQESLEGKRVKHGTRTP